MIEIVGELRQQLARFHNETPRRGYRCNRVPYSLRFGSSVLYSYYLSGDKVWVHQLLMQNEVGGWTTVQEHRREV